ncbi:MAG: YibE/F family protein [Candidatus Komeilibacteria bacterium]|nr:YibE/F family protein [Candidatus Komeilibacteria bacterium]
MTKLILIVLFLLTGLLTGSASVLAQEETLIEQLPTDFVEQTAPQVEYYQARVTDLVSEQKDEDPYAMIFDQYIQKVFAVFLNGPEKGAGKIIEFYPKSDDDDQKLKVGDKVYVLKITDGDVVSYNITEHYRFNALLWLTIIFIGLVVLVGRWQGLGSLVGLAFSFLVIIKFMVPRILAGQSPLIICLLGAMMIALVSIYIAHGFKLRTTLAVISTLLTIMITLGFDYLVIHWAKLFGAGTEEAVFAQFAQFGTINLRGLLLGGIIVGVLGVLDDITTAQAAVVDELKKAKPEMTFKELYRAGISVGKEHIASLVNTLVLAYVGASFPLVLLFQQYNQPLTYLLNSELVAEEIARTLIGSTALILAVPLTTALTAYVLTRKKASL